ncbi:hypothetical protein ORIO_14275 [Cereibacter azotoformans]|uniref:Uncharacterized protein n=2 Tax=Cereibacter TaxID=1653176 RepID=A0A2T5K8K7_9RHOB|nr:hypothetical protein [Cereibacter azotoformans]AXQ94837.1 hypothetical protein D0Z66_14125 [Cereibacter sphaeroides]MBO4170298.1 hypothetical protein [Cereibacter azotoformans]PTR18755.1 hypothetical protein C8J28_107180 [Cereibacter azotoformans]UIJ30410.1 hypothetical protein LV780_14105 [Cereibacter azotoformans]ULB11063.1 hypothetical protein ORIO_14275 [Cereibacter azotoformans]
MSRHLADKRTPSDGGRVKNFLKLARNPRAFWHRDEARPMGNRRVVEFLRIARGREA